MIEWLIFKLISNRSGQSRLWTLERRKGGEKRIRWVKGVAQAQFGTSVKKWK